MIEVESVAPGVLILTFLICIPSIVIVLFGQLVAHIVCHPINKKKH